MKQKTLFRGIATALATPMTSSGAIDYDAYGRLIDWQIESGVAGLVTCGTTGEASTMTAEEHRQTIALAVKRAAGRVPVIAGTAAASRMSAMRRASRSGTGVLRKTSRRRRRRRFCGTR